MSDQEDFVKVPEPRVEDRQSCVCVCVYVCVHVSEVINFGDRARTSGA